MAVTSFTPMPVLPAIQGRLIGSVVLVAITVVVVALRIVARLLTGSKLGWDDYLIIAAIPQTLGMLVCQGLWYRVGLGYAITDVPHQNLLQVAVILVPFELLYNTIIVTAKLSVLFFYLRVFIYGAMRRVTKLMLGLVVVWGFANLLQYLIVCRVVDGRWTFINNQKCPQSTPSYVSAGLFNCLTNLIIGLLPLYTIWSLKTVSVSTRLGLTTVFMLGISVTAVSVYRIYRLALPLGPNNPPLESMSVVAFLSGIETNLSLLCNSLPMLLPLYSYWRYRKFYAEDEDEYVSRVREFDEPSIKRRVFAFEDVANGLPLETIYGKDNIHFTVAVGAGDTRRFSSSKSKKLQKLNSKAKPRRGDTANSFEGIDGDSTRRLQGNAGPTGITIETKWTITEEQMPYRL